LAVDIWKTFGTSNFEKKNILLNIIGLRVNYVHYIILGVVENSKLLASCKKKVM